MGAQELLARGYVEIQNHPWLKPGARVRHIGHQWPGAFGKGTATVVAVYDKSLSAWAQSHHREDIEVIVRTDEGDEREWADYHCARVTPE